MHFKGEEKDIDFVFQSCPLERDIEDTQDHFVPRKLFLNGVETLKSVPKVKVRIYLLSILNENDVFFPYSLAEF